LVSLSADDDQPGAFVGMRVVSQPALGAAGALINAGARHRVGLRPNLALLPEISLTWRHVDAAARVHADVDRDVYSAYALSHPRSVDLGATLVHRPYIDTLGRYTAEMRLNPDLLGVDRVDARGRLQILPGSGSAPWIEIRIASSVRPASPLRERAFVRWQIAPEATFWHWVSHGARFRTTLELSAFVDTPHPGGARGGVFAGLSAAYDCQLGDGLVDFPLSSRPFRRRLEEGGPSVRPAEPPSDTYWSDGASP
jgi:hypothetical protein